MGLSRVSRVAQEAQDVASTHLRTRSDSQTARLEVSVEEVSAIARIDNHVVASDCVERDLDCSRVATWNILWNTVLHGRHDTAGCRQDVGTVRMVAPVVEPIPAPCLQVPAETRKVNGKPLRRYFATVDLENGLSMPVHIVRGVDGYPVSALQRRADHDGAACRDRNLRTIFDGLSTLRRNDGDPVNQIPRNTFALRAKCNEDSRWQSNQRVDLPTLGNVRIPFARPLQTVPEQFRSVVCEQTSAGIAIQDLYSLQTACWVIGGRKVQLIEEPQATVGGDRFRQESHVNQPGSPPPRGRSPKLFGVVMIDASSTECTGARLVLPARPE